MQRCAQTLDEEADLQRYTGGLKLIWISSPLFSVAAELLATQYEPDYIIGSGEADYLSLSRHIARQGKLVVLSIGTQTVEAIRALAAILDWAGVDYARLECGNIYPSPAEIVSLWGVTEMKNTCLKAVVGFSDHSIGPYMSLASLALGASILTRQYTDIRYRKGPDIINSMDPANLCFRSDRLKEIWIADNNLKHQSAPEEVVYRFNCVAELADKDLPEGHILQEAKILARRSGPAEISAYTLTAWWENA